MSSSRPSFEMQVEEGQLVQQTKALQNRLENANLDLVKRVNQLNQHNIPGEEAEDSEDIDHGATRDPAIIASELGAQITYLRKLKFQYLEQNAKDKYVKSIVSDIDDAPIVTADDNRQLSSINDQKKEKLKSAKERLSEVQGNIGLLAPMVEQDYQKVKLATEKAVLLSQKIIQARTSLLLLRQTHPQPRLTIPLADQKLADQVDEMQSLSDQVQSDKQKAKAEKEVVKTLTLEVETLQTESEEVQKAVKMSQVDEDDTRLLPLYDWYTTSLALQRSISGLEESHSVSENELQLTYRVDGPSEHPRCRITINLIFTPDTRQLAAVHVSGLDELGIDVEELIDAHVQSNDVHGLVAALLARSRAASAP